MRTARRLELEVALSLAKQTAAKLAAMASNTDDTETLCLRLAHAHAVGLVDQLLDLARGTPPPTAIASDDPAP